MPSATRPHLLLIHAGHAGGRTHAMVEAVKHDSVELGQTLAAGLALGVL